MKTKEKRIEEDRLDEEIRKHLNKGPDDYRKAEWQALREQLRLILLYPGKYVAYRDHYKGKGQSQRPVQREVLKVADKKADILRFLNELPEAEKSDIWQRHIEKPEENELSL